jgi:hypothetical protein
MDGESQSLLNYFFIPEIHFGTTTFVASSSFGFGICWTSIRGTFFLKKREHIVVFVKDRDEFVSVGHQGKHHASRKWKTFASM